MSRKEQFASMTIKGEQQPFEFKVAKIIYRDKKGKQRKFTTRVKLKKEVYLWKRGYNKETDKYDMYMERSYKYSDNRFVKRKHQQTKREIEIYIGKRLRVRKKSVFQQDFEGRIIFTYFYEKPKKGSKRGHKQTRKVSVSKNSTLS